MQFCFEFRYGFFESLGIVYLSGVLRSQSLIFKQPHFLFLSCSQGFFHAFYQKVVKPLLPRVKHIAEDSQTP